MVTRFEDLRVYQQAFTAAMEIYRLSKAWPREERYSLTDQIRRSSRSVCACIAEAWRKRRYPNHFISKLSDADGEAAETLNWLRFAHACGYLADAQSEALSATYDRIAGGLVNMMARADDWCGPTQLIREEAETYDAGTE